MPRRHPGFRAGGRGRRAVRRMSWWAARRGSLPMSCWIRRACGRRSATIHEGRVAGMVSIVRSQSAQPAPTVDIDAVVSEHEPAGFSRVETGRAGDGRARCRPGYHPFSHPGAPDTAFAPALCESCESPPTAGGRCGCVRQTRLRLKHQLRSARWSARCCRWPCAWPVRSSGSHLMARLALGDRAQAAIP